MPRTPLHPLDLPLPRTALLAGLLLAAAPALHAQELLGRRDTTFQLSEPVPVGGLVRIHAVHGEIAITQGRGQLLEFRAEKRLRGGAVEDIAFVVRRQADGITICAVRDEADRCDADGFRPARDGWRRGDRQATVRLTVAVPAGVRLSASSGNGDVDVAAAVRELRIASGNGDIRVRDAEGPVRATSGNGDIDVATTAGPVQASSGNGDIAVRMDALGTAGDVTLSSGNGRIVVAMPEGVGADVEATTGNGSVRSDLPIRLTGSASRQRLRGTLGEGGRQLRLTSGNGAIEIRRVP